MKEENIGYVSVVEYWNPSVKLRFIKRQVVDPNQVDCYYQTAKEVNVLQQLFTSNLGNREWKDVPIETE